MSRFRLYLQLDVTVVTQIHGNEGVTNINYGTEVWTTERFVADVVVHVVKDADADLWSKSAIWHGIH